MPENEIHPEIKTTLNRFQAEIGAIKNRRGQNDATLWQVKSRELSEADFEFWEEYKAIFNNLERALKNGKGTVDVRRDTQALDKKIKSTEKKGMVDFFVSWLGNRLAILDTYSINESDEDVKDSIQVMADERKEVFGQ